MARPLIFSVISHCEKCEIVTMAKVGMSFQTQGHMLLNHALNRLDRLLA